MLAAAVGGGLRFAVGQLWDRPEFAWGTLLVNLVGCGVLGFALYGDAALPTAAVTCLGAGFCGGLTTYSAFAVQAAGHRAPVNWRYLAATLLLCPLAVVCGGLV